MAHRLRQLSQHVAAKAAKAREAALEVEAAKSVLDACLAQVKEVSEVSETYGTPPYCFRGTFMEAIEAAEQQGKLLLANLQSAREPSTFALNCYTWRDEEVQATIASSFIFWQAYDDSKAGQPFQALYQPTELPATIVIDPATFAAEWRWIGGIMPDTLTEVLRSCAVQRLPRTADRADFLVAAARARVLALFEDAEQLRHDAHCAPAPFTPAARAPTPTPTPAPTPLPDDAADDAGSDMGYHDVGEPDAHVPPLDDTPAGQDQEQEDDSSHAEEVTLTSDTGETHAPQLVTALRLTPKEQALAAKALGGGGRPKDLLAGHSNIQLTRELMECLDDGGWLNDSVMNVYMCLLQERDMARQKQKLGGPKCHFFNSFFLGQLYKNRKAYDYKSVCRWTQLKTLKKAKLGYKSILEVDRVIMPAHVGPGEGDHWGCALIDLQAKEIIYYDSLLREEEWILEHLSSFIHDEALAKTGKDWDMSVWRMWCEDKQPSQHNDCDCGVFALLYAERLARGAPLDGLSFLESDMPFYRRKIAADIMNVYLEPEGIRSANVAEEGESAQPPEPRRSGALGLGAGAPPTSAPGSAAIAPPPAPVQRTPTRFRTGHTPGTGAGARAKGRAATTRARRRPPGRASRGPPPAHQYNTRKRQRSYREYAASEEGADDAPSEEPTEDPASQEDEEDAQSGESGPKLDPRMEEAMAGGDVHQVVMTGKDLAQKWQDQAQLAQRQEYIFKELAEITDARGAPAAVPAEEAGQQGQRQARQPQRSQQQPPQQQGVPARKPVQTRAWARARGPPDSDDRTRAPQRARAEPEDEAAQGPAPDDAVRCDCGLVCTKLPAKARSGRNAGRMFYKCPRSAKDEQPCPFFQWELSSGSDSDKTMRRRLVAPAARGVRRAAGVKRRRPVARGRAQGQPAGRRAPPPRPGAPSQGHRSKRRRTDAPRDPAREAPPERHGDEAAGALLQLDSSDSGMEEPAASPAERGRAPAAAAGTSRGPTGCIGLKNPGTTCYMNSVLQFLYHLNSFRQTVYQAPVIQGDGPSSVALALQTLFCKLQVGARSASTEDLIMALNWEATFVFQQQDVHDFLKRLQSLLEEQAEGTALGGVMRQLFGGHWSRIITYPQGERELPEDFMELQLAVRGHASVNESIASLFAPETMRGTSQYMTPKHGLQDATARWQVNWFPPVLLLHLGRFTCSKDARVPSKVHTSFEFQEDLDLDYDNRRLHNREIDPDHNVRNLYTLHSVLSHQGGIAGGHYHAYIRPDGRQWLRFSDEQVTLAEPAQAIQGQYGGHPKSFSAYMLVYIRKSDWDQVMPKLDTGAIPEWLRRRLSGV